ncbi:MAG: membrane lipoprotein lipid attachment site-containing protein, partial [Dysgonamonadaceae bacterium]|nr:membrane lipoprotein lipid attachment site-containing protein [Dysgonamonadaceae bacterium]
MKKIIFLLSIVAGMFIIVAGCNDAVDNGVFEEQAVPVAPAAQAHEEEVDVPLRSSVPDDFYLQPVRAVEVWGATGLWCTYEVKVNYTTPAGETGSIIKTGGRLWHTTSVSLSGIPEGSTFNCRIKDEWYIENIPDTYIDTESYIYSPSGKRVYSEVWGGF